MNKHKMLSLALLDLCAFAVTQVPAASRGEAEKNFEYAYQLAEKRALPYLKDYRDVIEIYKHK